MIIETPKQMQNLPDYSVVVSAVAYEPTLGEVCIATQKIAGEWYAAGMDGVPIDLYQLQRFFPATLVFQIDKGVQ